MTFEIVQMPGPQVLRADASNVWTVACNLAATSVRFGMLPRARFRIPSPSEPPTWGGRDVLAADYNSTIGLYQKLVDVRFKLLAFVPTVTAIAVGIISLDQSGAGGAATELTIGIVGFAATVAIVVYEVRNSQIHDRTVHRLKHLERLLGLQPSEPGHGPQGMFGERGKGGRLFGVFLIKHDRALAVIYGVVIGAWTWVIVTALEASWDWPVVSGAWPTVLKVVLPVLAGLAISEEVSRLGGEGREPALVYELSKVQAQGEEERGSTGAGCRIHDDLMDLHKRAGCQKLSVYEMEQQTSKELIGLGFATRAIEDRQRWYFWLWCRPSRTKDCRKRRLRIRACHPDDIDMLGGIFGADEVLVAMSSGLIDEQIVLAAQKALQRRFGRGAPWATADEIRLRIGLIRAARRAAPAVGTGDPPSA